MSTRKLSKREAIELITPVVDNEVDEDTLIAFQAYLEQDPEVRAQYQTTLRLKKLVAERCPCAHAPEKLKRRVHTFLNCQQTNTVSDAATAGEVPTFDQPSKARIRDGSAQQPLLARRPELWRYAAVATVVLAVLLFGVYQNSLPNEQYNIEEYAYTHFTEQEGRLVPPTINTASTLNAELELEHAFGLPMTIPPLENSEFKGVVMHEFVPGFETPMMEYHLPRENQNIYIFAFNIPALEKFDRLKRSQDAIRSCVKAKDFHIRTINGKQVVSWKWEKTWYAAISNHQGETLASLIKPLQYTDN